MQKTQVRSLIRGDPTCHGAAKPVCHNCQACAPEPGHVLSPRPQLLKPGYPRAHGPQQEKPSQQEACTPQLESGLHWPQLDKSCCSSENPAESKKIIKLKKNFFFKCLWGHVPSEGPRGISVLFPFLVFAVTDHPRQSFGL